MPTIKKNDIITHTYTMGGLRVAIGERILVRAQLRSVEIPKTYKGKRVGVELVVRGRALPAPLNSRLLSTAYEVFIHQNGTVSIPVEAVRRKTGVRDALPV
jgi:hypothetical protein